MGQSGTSIYLSEALKEEIVETARSAGFDVSYGRNSGLAKFISKMLEEYRQTGQDDGKAPTLRSMEPELRHNIFKLSQMKEAQQRRASQLLELFFAELK